MINLKKKIVKINSLSIIFPFFNEEERLSSSIGNLKKLITYLLKKIDFEIILVNDGSNDSSDKIIKKFLKSLKKKEKKYINYLKYNDNKGKGFALKKGVKSSKKKWILTCDIDFSANPSEIFVWQKKSYIVHSNQCYFGSRNLKNSNIKYKFYRKFLGGIFSNLRNFIFNLNLLDTQCGFKLYPAKIAKLIFSKIKEFGYVHDVEICILLKKNNIKFTELPIKWKHVGNSKLNIITDGAKMIFDLFVLKLKI